jgi:hypothetical protein
MGKGRGGKGFYGVGWGKGAQALPPRPTPLLPAKRQKA